MREVIALEGLSREDWLEARRKGIGSSDIPAVLGLSRFAGPFDVYCDKVTGEDGPSMSAMKLGSALEDGIANYYADETGCLARVGEVDHPATSAPNGQVKVTTTGRPIPRGQALPGEGTKTWRRPARPWP